ncbi:YTH-domain-containing protein [Acephala macrosclerotiorum]|nr:YTH-domain-containing protein [Acephala macrosclerotiorum]
MWPNGFGSNGGPFSNNFNQDDYHQLYGSGSLGPQYFDQQGMMQLDKPNGEELMDGDYEPELGFTNNLNAFAQNHSINAQFPSSPFVPHEAVQPATPPVNPRDPQMNARAAELKAQLLKKRKERANSATPPVPTLGSAAKQAVRPEALNSILGSLNIPKSTDEKHEQDLNDLISQYSTSKPSTGAAVKEEKKASNIPSVQQIPPKSATPAKSQALAANITKPANQGKPLGNETNGKTLGSRHTSNGSVSEGEIFEDTIPTEAPSSSAQSKEVKQAQNKNMNKMSRSSEQTSRNSREGQNGKPAYTRAPREEPRRRTPPTSPKGQQLSNSRGDRREEVNSRKENRNQVDPKVEQKPHSEAEKPLQPRQDLREEANQQPQTNGALARVEPLRQSREQVVPSLDDILPHDEDLREWLAITGFFNEPYRKKILNRRRAIAALDAQRDKLLAEMEIEERGGIPAPALAQPSVASMLPPPIPNKLGGRAESVPAPATLAVESQRVVSNKRPYSEVQDVRDAPVAEKTPRIEEKSTPQRAKDDEEVDHRRPRSSGFDSSRRFSASRRDDEDPFRHRYEGRGRSRERDVSPGRRAYENRPPARYHEEHAYDRNDFRDQGYSSYRSNKPFDPDYRGRGRGGRGSGRGRGDPRDQREYQPGPDFKNDAGFGSRIANNKPYRDLKGFEKGGRGDTRYFIVKSFNEENVLKCIEDSVWTTQVQNGDVFKEAFETCKNVILVFSINKSRAFQGYARMESLPGSVEVPDWQRSINWESTGAFRVKWLVICSTRFHRVGHLKNKFNENQAVLIGKDGQEIEERCGAALIDLIDEEADQALGGRGWDNTEDRHWADQY